MNWGLAIASCVSVLACIDTASLAQPVRTSVVPIAPMVLNGYSHFPRLIGAAPVYDLNDHQIGSMQKLLAAPDNRPTAIEIWLPSGRSLTVVASNVSYDEQHNSVTVGLNDTELGLNTVSPGR